MTFLERIKATGVGGMIRLSILVLFACAGGWALRSAAPAILDWLYAVIAKGVAHENNSVVQLMPMIVLGVILGLFCGSLVINWITKLGFRWDRMNTGDKVNIFLGVFIGLVASVPFLLLFNSAGSSVAPYLPFAIVGLTLGFASLSIYALQSMEEILPWTQQTIKSRRRGIKILDTNVIIDGRIYDVLKAGFLEGELYVPAFVLEELQHIADHSDSLKRQRGRRGLEVLHHMRDDFALETGIYDKHASDRSEEVDSRIVRIAKAIGADIVTNDWNLNRVAKLQQLNVLNLNDLALAMKPNVLPGEALRVLISKEGNQFGQGVGYLEDGTMVVIENGRNHVGETHDVMVTQVIQTERGKMIFAEMDVENEQVSRRRRSH